MMLYKKCMSCKTSSSPFEVGVHWTHQFQKQHRQALWDVQNDYLRKIQHGAGCCGKWGQEFKQFGREAVFAHWLLIHRCDFALT